MNEAKLSTVKSCSAYQTKFVAIKRNETKQNGMKWNGNWQADRDRLKKRVRRECERDGKERGGGEVGDKSRLPGCPSGSTWSASRLSQ